MSQGLQTMFARAREESRACLLPYMMAGVPSVADNVDLFVAMAEAGADGFEIGLPYADPLMDGPVIQEAGRRALAGGVTLDIGLDVVRRVVAATAKPSLVMTYVNPILRAGPAEFCKRAADAGAAGLIVADLPVDEAEPLLEAARSAELGLVLFAAPTISDTRLARVIAADPVFVYGVAEVGVTGERVERSSHAADLVGRIRSVTDIPIVLGVGISGPDSARHAARLADGVIVGSALVRRVLESSDVAAASSAVAAAVAELADAVR